MRGTEEIPISELDLSLLKDKRKKLGLTQQEVSLSSGVPQRQISLIENNKYFPNMKTLIRILDSLEMKIKFGGKTPGEIKAHKDRLADHEWKSD